METANNIRVEEMSEWEADDWAAFGVSLWELRGNIIADPAYIDAGIDILVGLKKSLSECAPIMRKYIADLADSVADLLCERIRSLADDCRWDARQVAQSSPAISASDNNPPDDGGDLSLPPEWFDVLGDDDDE